MGQKDAPDRRRRLNTLADGDELSQNLRILRGGLNDDATVNIRDAVGVHPGPLSSYNRFADMNGNGVVDLADVTVIRKRTGIPLP